MGLKSKRLDQNGALISFHSQNTTVEKSKAKLTQLTESYEAEKKEAQERREAEVEELQQQLRNTKNELTAQQDKTTAHKQLLDKITTERDAMQVGNFAAGDDVYWTFFYCFLSINCAQCFFLSKKH